MGVLTCTVGVLTCFVICGCFVNISALAFVVFVLFVLCLLYCFVYVCLFLFVLSVLV